MAFRFKLNEPVEKGFRRIGLEQIERAERELSASESLEVATHETRKSLKRIRALLRLVRPGLGDTVYRTENARFRDIGALLSSARDSDVLLQTVTKLETLPGEVANAALAAAKKLILEARDRDQPARGEGVRQALEKLSSAKKKAPAAHARARQLLDHRAWSRAVLSQGPARFRRRLRGGRRRGLP